MEERVRKALVGVDPNLVLYGVDPYTKVVSADFQQENMIATLTTLFGLLGLMLAAVGLYGVLAYVVKRRTGVPTHRDAFGLPGICRSPPPPRSPRVADFGLVIAPLPQRSCR